MQWQIYGLQCPTGPRDTLARFVAIAQHRCVPCGVDVYRDCGWELADVLLDGESVFDGRVVALELAEDVDPPSGAVLEALFNHGCTYWRQAVHWSGVGAVQPGQRIEVWLRRCSGRPDPTNGDQPLASIRVETLEARSALMVVGGTAEQERDGNS